MVRTRFLLFVAVGSAVVLLWRSFSGTAGDLQRFYCFGPAKSPMQMSTNERALWQSQLQTQAIFNHHRPVEINSSTIEHVNMNDEVAEKGVNKKDRILILTPLKDAAFHLQQHFDLLSQLTYDHQLIDLAFLVSDSTDNTVALLSKELEYIQTRADSVAFRSATIITKDFNFHLSQDVKERHGFAAQAPRRKAMARARNYLLGAALKPEHNWVYWRDVDIVDSPKTMVEDMISHNRDVIVPNIWFHRYENGKDIEGRFDYNSWQESPTGAKLAASLGKDDILVEGYSEYKTERIYMCRMGDWRENQDVEIPLDGIGGVNIFVKAEVHRSGINFPAYPFENQVETEGFAKMAKRAGYGVFGLPNYVVWHIDTEELPGNA